jgi:hypothetical protein
MLLLALCFLLLLHPSLRQQRLEVLPRLSGWFHLSVSTWAAIRPAVFVRARILQSLPGMCFPLEVSRNEDWANRWESP